MTRFPLLALAALTIVPIHARDVLLQGKDKLVLWQDGKIAWEMPWGAIHDLHQSEDGLIYVQKDMREVCGIDPAKKEVVWRYDASKSNGNEGKRMEVHAFQPLGGGKMMVAESGIGRIIEVNQDGELLKELKLKIDRPDAHRDTRLARKLENGHYLVCHEGDGTVREYDGNGTLVWDFPVPMFGKEAKGGHGPEAFGNAVFCALRLKNGNTLIATGNGHSVLEVTPAKEIVWKIEQKDLPGITLGWVTTLQVLPNGNYVIGNCHAGPGQPILIEVEPKTRKVVWQLDGFEAFGNDVSNTLVTKP